jgi:hypothetical protein
MYKIEIKIKKQRMKVLRASLLTTYKTTMQNIYKENRDLDSNIIRIEFLKVINSHICEKVVELINRKTRKVKKNREEKLVQVDQKKEIEAKELSW